MTVFGHLGAAGPIEVGHGLPVLAPRQCGKTGAGCFDVEHSGGHPLCVAAPCGAAQSRWVDPPRARFKEFPAKCRSNYMTLASGLTRSEPGEGPRPDAGGRRGLGIRPALIAAVVVAVTSGALFGAVQLSQNVARASLELHNADEAARAATVARSTSPSPPSDPNTSVHFRHRNAERPVGTQAVPRRSAGCPERREICR